MMRQNNKDQARQNLTIPGLTAEHGMSDAYWRREVWSGRLRCLRLGRRVLIPRSEIETYLKQRTGQYAERRDTEATGAVGARGGCPPGDRKGQP